LDSYRYITRAHERYQLRATLNQAAVGLLAQDSVIPAPAEKSVTASTLDPKTTFKSSAAP
jgi:hypothetical protein